MGPHCADTDSMAELPNPPDPAGPPVEAFRRPALEATLAEALRDSRLSGRPAPPGAPEARSQSVPAPVNPAAGAPPSMIGSRLTGGMAPPPSGAGGGRPTGISRLVPPGNNAADAAGLLGGALRGGIGGSVTPESKSSGYSLGSDTLDPEEVQAVIELRKPSPNGPRRYGSSSAPPAATPSARDGDGAAATVAASGTAQKSTSAGTRDEAARRAAAISSVAPWTPEADDILPGLLNKRAAKSKKTQKTQIAGRTLKTKRTDKVGTSPKSKRR